MNDFSFLEDVLAKVVKASEPPPSPYASDRCSFIWYSTGVRPAGLLLESSSWTFHVSGRLTCDSKEWAARGGYFRKVNGFTFSVLQNK